MNISSFLRTAMTRLYSHRISAYVLNRLLSLLQTVRNTSRSLASRLKRGAMSLAKWLIFLGAIFVFLGYLILRTFRGLIYRKSLGKWVKIPLTKKQLRKLQQYSHQLSKEATNTMTNSQNTDKSTTQRILKKILDHTWKMESPFNRQVRKWRLRKKP